MESEKRLIDANALLEEHCGGCSLEQRKMCENDPVCGSAMWIVEATTVDAVEVVRCKDCKHFCPYDGEEHKGDCAELVGLESCVYEDDFCSYGERKDNES